MASSAFEPHVIVVDNYDSFTFNLVQLLLVCGARVTVVPNDGDPGRDVIERRPDGVLISPGPCGPPQAGISGELVQMLAGVVPLFGVCLGHQVIAAAFGARIVPARRLMHGKASVIAHDGRHMFHGLPPRFDAGRYHSLVVAADSLPRNLELTAWTETGEVMGLRHKTHDIEGVQFHPESVLTPRGIDLVTNWVLRVRRSAARQLVQN